MQSQFFFFFQSSFFLTSSWQTNLQHVFSHVFLSLLVSQMCLRMLFLTYMSHVLYVPLLISETRT